MTTVIRFEDMEECEKFLDGRIVKYRDLIHTGDGLFLIYEDLDEDENLVRLNKNVQLFNTLIEGHEKMSRYIEGRGRFGHLPEVQMARESICNALMDVITDMSSDYEGSFREGNVPSPRKEYERLFSKKLDDFNKLPEGMADCCYDHQEKLVEGSKNCNERRDQDTSE